MVEALSSLASAAVYMALLCVYQVAWLNDNSTVKVWEKSRRIGASWVEALYTVLSAARTKANGGQNTYYLSYNKDMTRQFINDCAWWAKVLGVVCGTVEEIVSDYDKDITIFRITMASGHEIAALPSEARSLRSKQGRVIIDEAAFVEDLAELLKAAMALLMWGGQVVILSTHNGADNAFNELINEIHSGKKPYNLHHTDISEALEGGLYKAICRKKGIPWTPEGEAAWLDSMLKEYGDAADEELFCIPSQGSSVFLTGALIENNMEKGIPVFRWQPPADDFVDWSEEQSYSHTLEWCDTYLLPLLSLLPKECRHNFGSDFGRTGDLTDFVPGTEQPDLTIRIPFMVELRNCPHRTQKQICFYIIDHLPRFSGAAFDARGNGSYLAEAARQEYGPDLVLEVMITEKFYRETTPKLKSRLEDNTIILPLDAFVRDDLRAFKVIRGVARIPDTRTSDKGGKRHGDAAIGILMLIHAHATIEADEPFEVHSVVCYKAGRMFQGY